MQPYELKVLRKAAGMSQTQMAEALGLHRATVSDMERGDAPIEKRTALSVIAIACEAQLERCK